MALAKHLISVVWILTSLYPSLQLNDICYKTIGTCPPSWKRWGDHCYNITAKRFTFIDAKDKCQQLGGYLAAPGSDQETDFLVDLIPLGNNDYPVYGITWINCIDSGDYTWQCFDGVNKIEYTNWYDGQPQQNEEKCAIMRKENTDPTVDGEWHDYNCVNQFAAVCKKPLQSLHL